MRKLSLLLISIAMVSCIEKTDISIEPEPDALEELTFPQDFTFETSKTIDLDISDLTSASAIYEIKYTFEGESASIGSYIKEREGLKVSFIIPSSIRELEIIKYKSRGSEEYHVDVLGNSAVLQISPYESDSDTGSCIDHLYAVNTNSHFFKIDVSNQQYGETTLPNLPGGSIANALDQVNGIVYINVGKTLYSYDISSQSFSVKHTGNPFNGNYPRLEYKDGFFYMSNGSNMYKVNASTNAIVGNYTISGFVNGNGGGDLAFDSNGDLYLACFSGLYKFTSINDNNGTASITRISAENFPYQLTSMAIDRQDRIFVGTNSSSSKLIQISKEDGAYSIVRTFNKKINDLTAWKCEVEDLSETDSDGDGVIDELDDYPNDPDAATDVFTPSELGYGSYAFEDMWPNFGDYDFNDLVVNYRYTNILNSANQSVRLKMNFVLKAAGAKIRSGFGIELDVNPLKISSVAGHSTIGNNTTLDAKGLEASQGKAVIIVFNNTHDHMQPAAGEEFVNTDPNESIVNNVSFDVIIEFTEPIDPSEIGSAPFNPFIFSTVNRGQEVHLSGKMPTSLADDASFGTSNDDSNIGAGKTYQTQNNLPWAIHIIHNFRYPIENARINTAYNHFVDWAQSGGVLYTDWYGDNSGYRNTNKLFFQD